MERLTTKQFNKEIGDFKGTRSLIKRWRRAYYTKERTETPLSYFLRLLAYKQ